eukprot:6734449-Prorocentrum_lima.AAC.1
MRVSALTDWRQSAAPYAPYPACARALCIMCLARHFQVHHVSCKAFPVALLQMPAHHGCPSFA